MSGPSGTIFIYLSSAVPLFASGVAIGPSGAIFSIYTYIYVWYCTPVCIWFKQAGVATGPSGAEK